LEDGYSRIPVLDEDEVELTLDVLTDDEETEDVLTLLDETDEDDEPKSCVIGTKNGYHLLLTIDFWGSAIKSSAAHSSPTVGPPTPLIPTLVFVLIDVSVTVVIVSFSTNNEMEEPSHSTLFTEGKA
jgi:hypothetical protein